MPLKRFIETPSLIAEEGKGDDRDFVLQIVKQNSLALEFASEQLRNDRDIVLAAVSEFGGALDFAGVNLQDDEEIVLTAINNGKLKYDHIPFVFENASERLRKNKEVVLDAVVCHGDSLLSVSYTHLTLPTNREV